MQKFFTEERARLMFATCPCLSKLQLVEKTWNWGIREPTGFLPPPHPTSGAENSPRAFGAPVPVASKPVFPGPHCAGDTENPDSPLQGILLSHSCSSYQLLSASCRCLSCSALVGFCLYSRLLSGDWKLLCHTNKVMLR